MFSRCGSLLPSISADARYIDAGIVSQAKRCRDKKKDYIANLKLKAACLEAYNKLLLQELEDALSAATMTVAFPAVSG